MSKDAPRQPQQQQPEPGKQSDQQPDHHPAQPQQPEQPDQHPGKQQDVQLKGSYKPDGSGYRPRDYKAENRGAKVGPGETWHDLTLDERIAHMRRHENRWRDRFVQESGSSQGTMNWTRG